LRNKVKFGIEMPISKKLKVIENVINAFEKGSLIPSFHAQQQMETRDVQMSDIIRNDGKDKKEG